MTRTDTFFSFLCGGCGGGGVYEKLELIMGWFKKNEGKYWGGVHIIPVGNIPNSSETPQAINSDRSLIDLNYTIVCFVFQLFFYFSRVFKSLYRILA